MTLGLDFDDNGVAEIEPDVKLSLIERFATDFASIQALRGLDGGRWGSGLWRIGVGLFKKFVIADGLAQGMSLTPLNAAQATSTGGLWLLLYGYAFRLFFHIADITDRITLDDLKAPILGDFFGNIDL